MSVQLTDMPLIASQQTRHQAESDSKPPRGCVWSTRPVHALKRRNTARLASLGAERFCQPDPKSDRVERSWSDSCRLRVAEGIPEVLVSGLSG